MINFGERLAYWYLRLNGFLMVENFVLHRHGMQRTSEADLLGIRLRHSEESIDGGILSIHETILRLIGKEGATNNVAVIVQVKTGTATDSGGAFHHDRIYRGLKFIGALSPAVVDSVASELKEKPSVSSDGWVFAKILIAEAPKEAGAVCLPLTDALRFIEERLCQHCDRKVADRLFFSDELMQFMAWRMGFERPAHG